MDNNDLFNMLDNNYKKAREENEKQSQEIEVKNTPNNNKKTSNIKYKLYRDNKRKKTILKALVGITVVTMAGKLCISTSFGMEPEKTSIENVAYGPEYYDFSNVNSISTKNIDDYEDIKEIEEIESIDEEDKKEEKTILNSTYEGIVPSTIYETGKCGDYDKKCINDFLETSYYDSFEYYSKAYGLDPKLMVALSMQESSLNLKNALRNYPETHELHENSGYGLLQVEYTGKDRYAEAHNYITGEDERELIDFERLCDDVDYSVKIGCMMFQKSLNKYSGNIYLAIQSYNYGTEMMDKVLSLVENKNDLKADSLKKRFSNLSWLECVADVHNNPTKYRKDWMYKTYGDDKYIEHVLNYYIFDEDITYRCNNEKFTFNLSNGFCTKEETSDKKVSH